MLSIDFDPRKPSDYIFHILLPILAVLLPPFLVSMDIRIMPTIFTTEEKLFSVFAFCMWFVLFLAAYREIKAHPGISLERGIVVLLPLLVSFFFLVLLVEYAGKSFDYEIYEKAFRAVVAGKNPYAHYYLYPPLFAQIMAGVYSIGRLFGGLAIGTWVFVFYIHQCMQFLLLNLAYQLSSRFASSVGFSALQNKIIVSGLFLFNFPLMRMLHLNQINLYVLNAILIALLAIRKFPFWSGSAVAVGGLIKVYPIIMGVPLLLMKKWKALAGTVVSGIVILFLQTNFGQDFRILKQFFYFFISFPAEQESSIWIRNTTVLSLARNIIRFVGLSASFLMPMVILGTLIVLIWMGYRFYQREKIYASLSSGEAAENYRQIGHLIDFVSLSLLITPSAWDHHFVLALPLAIWTFALVGKEKPGKVGVALSFIFVLSPFDIFPFSYLRMIGVIALLILASPNVVLKPSESRSILEVSTSSP